MLVNGTNNNEGKRYQRKQTIGRMDCEYDRCLATIGNNDFDDDEIAKSGFTMEKADVINAPRIKECLFSTLMLINA